MTATGILLVACPDRPGIVAAVASFVASHGGNVIDLQQHTDHTDSAFFQRVEFELDGFDLARPQIVDAFLPVAERYSMRCRSASRTSGSEWGSSRRGSPTAFRTCSTAGGPASYQSRLPW